MARSRRSRKRYRWLCSPERERVLERLRAGDPVLEIAAAFDVGKMTVYRIGDHAALAGRRVSHSGWRLSYEERAQIAARLELGQGVREIAAVLGRSPSTISREIARNGGRARYRSLRAEQRAQRCARRPKATKLSGRPGLLAAVEEGLEGFWSPEQISARLKHDHRDDEEMRISHETIYRSLYVQSRGELRWQLSKKLRTGRRTRRARGRVETRGQISEMVPIAQRPPEVDERRVPGHWEGDLLVGAGGRTAIVTLVERRTRYVLLAALEDQTTLHVTDVLAERIAQLPAHLARSLTWDQGREMAAHKRFTDQTGIQVYFCDPHSPWQRGSNENTNGLLRQYLPKGTDLSVHTQDDLDEIAASLNGRPRQTLGWRNPAEKMLELLETA
ncbi:MAG: IS30 family transposase [Solirubrobacteraceae bacterium]